MSMLARIYLVVLVPIVALSALHLAGLQTVMDRHEQGIREKREFLAAEISHGLFALAGRLDKAAINLSRPAEIRDAVAVADNKVLFDWSESFIDPVDSVVFADADGIVLSRAPDEFRFGDSVAELGFWHVLTRAGRYLGAARIDGVPSIVAARAVRKYDDMVLGAVLVVVRITPSLLSDMLRDPNLILRFVDDTGAFVTSADASKATGGEVQRTIRLVSPYPGMALPGRFEVSFLADDSRNRMQELEYELLGYGIAALLAAALAVYLVMRRQFVPYRRIEDSVLDYSRERIDLEELTDQLGAAARLGPSSRARRIAEALLNMTETLRFDCGRGRGGDAAAGHAFGYPSGAGEDRDEPTGLNSRSALERALAKEIERSGRYNSPLSVVLLGMDQFRRINAAHGHRVGDEVLRHVASLLRGQGRGSDLPGRWSEKEFLILCPGVDERSALAYAERLRGVVENAAAPGGLRLTVSCGVALYRRGESGEMLVARAEAALREAEDAGRNTVHAADHS